MLKTTDSWIVMRRKFWDHSRSSYAVAGIRSTRVTSTLTVQLRHGPIHFFVAESWGESPRHRGPNTSAFLMVTWTDFWPRGFVLSPAKLNQAALCKAQNLIVSWDLIAPMPIDETNLIFTRQSIKSRTSELKDTICAAVGRSCSKSKEQ